MFRKVNIEKVKQVISFSGKNACFNGDNTIPELQTKGVTALCKILNGRQYAYLADEVGMGKTYQAIGVMSMLLEEKPGAKILIIAPNRSVQNNWLSEIQNFQQNNLLLDIELSVKNIEERSDFIKFFSEEIDESITLTRLTTFSTISDVIVKCGDLNYQTAEKVSIKKIYDGLGAVTGKYKYTDERIKFDTREAGKICGKFLRNYTEDFDLVIIDEAQNMRNENNATSFLNYWLGLKRCKDSKSDVGKILGTIRATDKENSKFLLMSATPAHRCIDSLRNQLLYFEDSENIPEGNKITHDYLSKFLIRRLRTYNKESKYNVRRNTPVDVSRSLDGVTSEAFEKRLFLALIQSKLAKESVKNNSTYKIGFLETFESYKPTGETSAGTSDSDEKEFENGNYMNEKGQREAPDKKMLQKISKSFYEAFGKDRYPPHPKYSFMEAEIQNLVDNNLFIDGENPKAPDKAVIFVRRLATVDELETRLNTLYEKRIVSYWANEFNLENATLKDVQREFEDRYDEATSKDSNIEEIRENDVDGETDVTELDSDSLLINWLALKKQHIGAGRYAVSKFKKSLLKNKTNSYLFSENYFTALYDQNEVEQIIDDDFVKEINEYVSREANQNRYVLEHKGKKRYNTSELLPLCCYLALRKKGNVKYAKFIKQFYQIDEQKIIEKDESSKIIIKRRVIKSILEQDSLWNHINMADYNWISPIDNYDTFCKREVLKAVAEKYLKASEAVLELMFCYINKKNSNICEAIINRLYSNKCTHGARVTKLFEDGELVCKQLLGSKLIKCESKLKTDLKFLDLQQWVMPAVGGNKGNDALIKRFNTPFYPDFIVCTDVLKEGINLHLFCNRIYHYGLAWTPGDLEQRIGRIDRFFSKTHRERANQENLSEDEKTRIEVNYPYLGKSVDEHQLKQVLRFKLSADPLLDSREEQQIDILIDFDEKSVEELAGYIPENTDVCPYSGDEILRK